MTDEEAAMTSSRPTHLTDEAALDEFVSTHDPALVQFYTNGCTLCQSMEPVLGIVAKQLDLAIGLINPRDDPPLVDRFQVQSVPLLVLFADGNPVDRRAEGFIEAEAVVDWIETATN